MATKMQLGGNPLWRNPTQFSIPKDEKHYSIIPTYSGVAFFTWGLFTAGQIVELEWEWMDSAAFGTLQGLLEDDVQKVWDPKISGEGTFNVELLSLNGKYVESALHDANWRQNVRLELLVRSEN